MKPEIVEKYERQNTGSFDMLTIKKFFKMSIKRLNKYDKLFFNKLTAAASYRVMKKIAKLNQVRYSCTNDVKNVCFYGCAIRNINQDSLRINNILFKKCHLTNIIAIPQYSIFEECILKNIMFLYGTVATIVKCNLVNCNINDTLPKGDLIVYKKLKNNIIAELLIPSTAKRFRGIGKKCRAEYAVVLSLYHYLSGDAYSHAHSLYDNDFIYEVGKTVRAKGDFGENRFRECGPGIHFFIHKADAINYNIARTRSEYLESFSLRIQ